MGSALGLAIAAARAGDPQTELTERNRSRNAARRLPGLAVAGLGISLATFLAARWDQSEAEQIARLRVTPQAEQVRARTEQERQLQQQHLELQENEKSLSHFARGRASRSNLLARLVRNFGPEITDYGEADFRLLECGFQKTAQGTELTGRTRAPLVDPRAATTLRQRLLLVEGLRGILVEEIEEERDEFLETTVYRFSGSIDPGGAP